MFRQYYSEFSKKNIPQKHYTNYTGRKVSASLGYVKERREGEMDSARGSKTPYRLWLPLPPRTTAGLPPTCVFVAVIEARRYLAAGVGLDGPFEHLTSSNTVTEQLWRDTLLE
jgi:hypothetical protein